jgi:hypothetical protein
LPGDPPDTNESAFHPSLLAAAVFLPMIAVIDIGLADISGQLDLVR